MILDSLAPALVMMSVLLQGFNPILTSHATQCTRGSGNSESYRAVPRSEYSADRVECPSWRVEGSCCREIVVAGLLTGRLS